MKVTAVPFAIALATGLLLLSGPADAQGRGRGGVRSGGSRAVVVVGGGFGYRPFYSPFYDPFYYGGYYRPFYWYPQYGYGQGFYNDDASVRIEVKPRETEVFIDNYYAGTVDDFDGIFQRLHLEPGSHTVTLYLDGYKTVRQQIYVQPTGTFKMKYTMVALGPGDVAEPRPVEPPPPAQPQAGYPAGPFGPTQAGPNRYPPPQRGRPQGQPPYQQGPPPYQQGPPPQISAQPGAGAGTLSVRVQPGNAEVFIDGEKWNGPSGDERLLVQVSPGQHHVEVRHDGYRTYESDVEVRPGDTSAVNVSLTRQ